MGQQETARTSRRHLRRAMLGCAILAVLGASSALAWTDDEIIIIGRRLDPLGEAAVYSNTVIDADRLRNAPRRQLDDILRQIPGFGLFRRADSLTLHPTSQGVSLRGIGPSGAGRTLVLLDGVPVNDPFGGWVNWTRIPASTLDRVEILEGGGAGPWGNAALGGVIRLSSHVATRSEAEAEAIAGGRGLLGASGRAAQVMPKVTITVDGQAMHSDGDYLISPDQRGPVDRRAKTDLAGGNLAVTAAPGDNWTVRAKAGYYSEKRLNGTALTSNATRIAEGSAGLSRQAGPDEWGLDSQVYVRRQHFRSGFSSINAARTAETPSLEQYDVPTTGLGGNVILRWPAAANLGLTTGLDVRHVSGETLEYFRVVGGKYTSRREAGGEQTLGGMFAEINWRPISRLALNGGVRLDHWRQDQGRRNEYNLATGAQTLAQTFASQSGTVVNGRGGASFDITSALAARAAVYSAFRAPTLNELYRPFRIGNDITEANPALRPERSYGGELGLSWKPDPDYQMSATWFSIRLKDAISNVTLTAAPGLYAPLNIVVPAGGSLAQRLPLDRLRVEGVELSATARPVTGLALTARYLHSQSRVLRAAVNPALAGKKLAQTPSDQASFSADVTLVSNLTVTADVRVSGRQFDNDLNTISLRPSTTADLGLAWRILPRLDMNLAVTNLFDSLAETGRTADGIVSVSAHRNWTLRLIAKM